MRSHDLNSNWLRILVLSAVLVDVLIWLACVSRAVVDSNPKTQLLHRDLAITATAYTVVGGAALVLAWRSGRLGLALLLAAPPVMILAAVVAALLAWG